MPSALNHVTVQVMIAVITNSDPLFCARPSRISFECRVVPLIVAKEEHFSDEILYYDVVTIPFYYLGTDPITPSMLSGIFGTMSLATLLRAITVFFKLIIVSNVCSIDMYTSLYHALDVLMPAIHRLVHGKLMDTAIKQFKIAEYMDVRSQHGHTLDTNMRIT